MAGLASGIRLALAGKNSIILEKHNASGGLNSFYSIDGIQYDVGLHALTNYVAKGTKGSPLTKLLRQLRIPYESFDLSPQKTSKIHFPSAELSFNNEFSFFESQIADTFPKEIDAFRKLSTTLRELDAFNLSSGFTSTRESIRKFFKNPLLESMLLCPTMYYGSATENDMDFGQFAIMFRSLFFEGFARPLNGVRTIIKTLQDQYRSLGGVRKMRCGVAKILSENNSAKHLILEDGSTISADKIISTAGISETLKLCQPIPDNAESNIGNLGFTETISLFEDQPSDLGWKDTILFFSTEDDFTYQSPTDKLVDPSSGVICMPNNYDYPNGETLTHGILRITALAHSKDWFNLPETQYKEQKAFWYSELQKVALEILAPNQSLKTIPSKIVATDMFTPRTVHKYTGHLNGAIYGAPKKLKDGRTHLENLFIAGTDQGFLGIIGAMLSGISMTNLHCLKD